MAPDSEAVPRADSVDTGPVTDAVTGALPRGELQSRLDEALTEARRADGCCSVFLFDVDHFKTVNDAYGHARGDDVLRQVAERTVALVRAQDVLVRYGGDEFVLVLPGARRSDAMRAAIRLADGVNGEPFPGNPPLSVSISLGVATFPDDGADAEALLATADRRNYLAKRRGRARVVGDNLAVEGHASSGRLLEREAALTAAQDFLLGVVDQGRGALRVTGERGAGHTRFLAEVTKLASLRGFQVYDLAGDDEYPSRRRALPGDAGARPGRRARPDRRKGGHRPAGIVDSTTFPGTDVLTAEDRDPMFGQVPRRRSDGPSTRRPAACGANGRRDPTG